MTYFGELEESEVSERWGISIEDALAVAQSVAEAYSKSAIDVRPKNHGRVIYFVQGEMTKLIKIGQTATLAVRLKMLQAQSPDNLVLLLAIVANDRYQSDTDIHKELAEHRAWGEWFRPDKKVLDLISSLETEEVNAPSLADWR